MSQQLIISPSPHIHSGDTIEKNMYGVLIALIPAFLVSLYVFRSDALIVTGLAAIFCVLFEYLLDRFVLKVPSTIKDGSALVTGVLLAFNVPSNLPWWILAIGCLFAIGVGKLAFGGLGKNIFNPALAGRIFLLISFPAQMTTWPLPTVLQSTDATTAATILGKLKHAPDVLPNVSFGDMLFGFEGGSLGEVSAIALLLGFAYLLYKKIITWHIPITIFLTVFLFSGAIYIFKPIPEFNPVIQLLSGGLMLGAIFMATDYATSPMTKRGMVIYGIGIAVITMCIRFWGAYPEGVSFAILLMNGATPLINTYVKPIRFGK